MKKLRISATTQKRFGGALGPSGQAFSDASATHSFWVVALARGSIDVIIGMDAEGGSRTHKSVSSHDFESCASASSATSATRKSIRENEFLVKLIFENGNILEMMEFAFSLISLNFPYFFISMNESEFISAAQKGDAAAFNQVVRAYQESVYRTAYRVLGERAAAEDATQDAFVSAFKHIRAFRGGSFKAWLLRIVTNVCYDQLRAKQRRPATLLDDADEDKPDSDRIPDRAESPEEFAERQELGSLIQRGIGTLAPDHRLTLVYADVEGLSYEEIAQAMGTNVGTVKSRLSRARAELRDFLTAHPELVPAQYRLKSEKN